MTSEQYDGEEQMHEDWVDGDSPPRIWSPNRDDGKVRFFAAIHICCQ